MSGSAGELGPTVRYVTGLLLWLALCALIASCDEGEGSGASQRESRVEVLAGDLEVPWDIAFLPDGRALLTERPGRIRLLDRDGSLQPEPLARVETQAEGECSTASKRGRSTTPDASASDPTSRFTSQPATQAGVSSPRTQGR